MTELGKRILTAVVAGAVLLFLLLYHVHSAGIALAILAGLVFMEFITLYGNDSKGYNLAVFAIVLGVFLYWYYHSPLPDYDLYRVLSTDAKQNYLYMALMVFVAAIFALLVQNQLIIYSIALLYCVLPFFMLWKSIETDALAGLTPLFLVWITDSTAYFVGKYLGKHKLWPAVSPKKTWEGVLGGIAGALVFGWVIARPLQVPYVWWMCAMVAIATILGDLLQSYLKRKAQVKDTGSLLPGHGGLYDRFDGFLLAMPTWVLCWGMYLA